MGLVFAVDGLVRAVGLPAALVQANGVTYPPAWPPLLNFILGAGLCAVVTGLLLRLVNAWGRSGLAARGLALASDLPPVALPPRWERRATISMALVAVLGLGTCSVFGALGGLYPVGHYGAMSLPQDFFKNPLTVLAFVGLLVFLASPALGLLWVTRQHPS